MVNLLRLSLTTLTLLRFLLLDDTVHRSSNSVTKSSIERDPPVQPPSPLYLPPAPQTLNVSGDHPASIR